ncbi:alpha-taxilin-like [Oscarella lobularis]|uniref:alpha-taxilin-like n=1 Tax=Oscarella lobularis TaxID=121494 RepID=UPI0033135FD5
MPIYGAVQRASADVYAQNTRMPGDPQTPSFSHRERLEKHMAAKADIETTTSEGALLENGQASGGTSDQDEKAAEPTAESKGTGWKRKCEKALKQARLIQQQLNEEKKRRQEATRERDTMRNELSRSNLAKGRLENLCRELQKHSKAVKDESLMRLKEDELKRHQVATKFQATIDDVSTKMDEYHARNEQLKLENSELATKFKGLVEQYELREDHFEKLMKQKQLELQLSDAKLAQQSLLLAEVRQRHTAEKTLLVEQSAAYQKRCEELLAQEVDLKSQLAVYTEKFDEFQKTVSKSNEAFSSFKSQMEKMSKTVKKQEKEAKMWRSRWEASNQSVMKMTEERAGHEKVVIDLKGRIEKLEKLCRALQKERNDLRSQIREQEVQLSSAKEHNSGGSFDSLLELSPSLPESAAIAASGKAGDSGEDDYKR